MYKSGILCLVVSFAAIPSVHALGQEQTIEEMRKRADQVLSMGNVEARPYIEDVMKFADRLAKEGKSDEAVRYYEAGLRHHALDLKRQLACAQLLLSMGKKDDAMGKAKIVAKVAEEDELIIPAKKMLGQKVDVEIEAMKKLDGNSPTIILVPMGAVDITLLREIRQKVQDQVHIDVLVRSVPMNMPKFKRDPYRLFCTELRDALNALKEKDSDGFENLLGQAGIKEEELKSDEKVVKLFSKWLEGADEEVQNRFAAAVKEARSEEKQWNADDLWMVLGKAAAPYKTSNVKFVGVTRYDIYTGDDSFVFGRARIGGDAVMSYRRFMSSHTGETVNRQRLLKRAVNQALSSCGKTFGIDNCTDPTCPRAYPNSVAEHDVKSDDLCDKCRKALSKATGRN
jgi:predicted Zn-dependent protease